jgi:hypothetical protein
VDKAVENDIVKPGQYLILQFDFSRVARSRNINESVESLKREINLGLEEFKLEYTNDLGQSFASATSRFKENDPTGNLTVLIKAVDRVLRGIQKRGEESHPLWGIRGVYLFHTTIHCYAI